MVRGSKMEVNKFFQENGYFYIPNLILDPEALKCEPPHDQNGKRMVGILRNKNGQLVLGEDQDQVDGAFARYNFPLYHDAHNIIMEALEMHLGIDLLPTYYFDRFYYEGQKLDKHTDRPACEISVSIQVGSNSDKPWDFWFDTPNGKKSVAMNDGDGVAYKGIDIPHWRDPLKSRHSKFKKWWYNINSKQDDTYHHQIFFHYVDAQGNYVHHTYDRMNK